jgi:ribose transport system substrate-binding protein
MRPFSPTLATVLILCVATLIGSCTKPYHDQNERYVFVATNVKLPYWQNAEAGLLDAAKAVGVRAELVGPEGYQPHAELGTFQQVLDQHPAGICVSAGRPEVFQAVIDQAIAKGIPVICVDADVPRSKRVLYIGTDNMKAGQESLKRMAALLSDRGNIAVITIEGQSNLDERVAGVVDALKNFPALKLTKLLDDKGEARNAAAQVGELVQKKEKIDGIICLEATGGSGAAETLHRLGLESKMPIVAFDDDPETLDWIEQGVISATIAQKPYVMSYYALKLLDDLHHNAVQQSKDWRSALTSPMPVFVDTGTVVVDKSNLKEYREGLLAHVKPQ